MKLPELTVRQKCLLLIPIVVLTAILMFFLKDLARQLIAVPILYLFWAADVVLQIIPQNVLWGLFLLTGTIILLVSLLYTGRSAEQRVRPANTEHPGRVTELKRLIHFSQKWSYSKWNLAHNLTDLAAEIVAFQERCDVSDIKKQLHAGTYELPDELRRYFQAGHSRNLSTQPGFFARLLRRTPPQETDEMLALDPAIVIDFLAHHLEGENEHEHH